MTKTKITFGLFKCWRAISTGVLAVLLTTSAYAQTFSCIGEVNATVGTTCSRNLSAGELLTPAAWAAFPGATIEIKRNGVWIASPIISSTDIGQTLEVKAVSGTNTCWGWVKVEDKDAPIIRCPASKVVSCLQQPLPTTTGTIQSSATSTLPNTTLAEAVSGWYNDCSVPAAVTYTDFAIESSCTTPFTNLAAVATAAQTPVGTLTAAEWTTLSAAVTSALTGGTAAPAIASTVGTDIANLITANPNAIIKFIIRKFTVTDAYGNATSCYQVIGVKRLDATMTIIRPLDTAMNCTSATTDFSPEALLTRANGLSFAAYPMLLIPKVVTPTPALPACLSPTATAAQIATYVAALQASIASATGYDLVYLKSGAAVCGITVTYNDADLTLCAGSFKKLRNWRLQNWCGATITACPAQATTNPAVIELGEQAIKNLDLTAPTVKASYVTYDTLSAYICVNGANGTPLPRYILSGGVYIQNPATHKTDITARQVDSLFTGTKIETITPDVAGTARDIRAIGNSNSCSGNVVITLTATDRSCSPIGGQVVFTSSDNRMVAGTPVYDASTGETTITFVGNFDVQAAPYVVTFTATDACGYAKALQTFNIRVIDNAKPQPVCIEYLQLALGSDGKARLQAENLNRASTDNCTNTRNLKYLIRKMQVANADGSALIDNTDLCFNQWVDFTCLDAMAADNAIPNSAASATIGVVMRVCDEAGNYNDCMVQVLVEDKVRPTCIAPASRTIACNSVANLYNTAAYGTPTYYDNCAAEISEIPAVFNLNNCRQGTIVRSWTVTDKFGNTNLGPCSQTITVTGTSDFSVDFPDDIIASCGADVDDDETAKNAMLTNPITADGHIENNGCGVLAVEVSHTTPSATTDGSCYKVFRKYRVIDWCRYNPNNTNDNVNCYGRPVTGDRHSNSNWSNAVTGNSAAWDNLDVPSTITKSTGAAFSAGELSTRTQRGNLRDRKFRDADIYNFSGLGAAFAAADAAAAATTPPYSNVALNLVRTNALNVLNDSIALNYPLNTRNTAFPASHKDNWSFADGIICFTQTIKVIDNVSPTLTAVGDDLEHCDYGTAANCAAHYTATLEGADQCQGGVSTEDLVYGWTLVRADGQPLVAAVGATPAVMSYTGATKAIDIASLPYDIIYKINWTVADRCGNASGDEYQIRFRDCKKPSIVCGVVNAEVMPNGTGTGGQIAIWPSELLVSVSDNCTDQAYLRSRARIRKAGTGTGYPVSGTSVVFTCDDYTATPDHRALVEVWTQDYAGNADFCIATVTLQNNMGACGTSGVTARINGGIQTEARTNIENVTVKATMNGTQLAASMTTRADGAFALAGLTVGQNYAVRGERTDNVLNGVTTYDIALISRHILGTETLNTPYKIIAADVNGDRDVNTADMIALRRAVLHLSPAFPNSVPSWRFINQTYAFRNATSPLGEDFPEVVNIANAPQGANAANFVGIKVGDVNLNATANGLAGLDIRGAAGTVTLKTDDLNLVAGKTYTVQLKSDDFKVVGMQGTLNFAKGYADQIAVVGQLPNMTEGNFGVFENAITTSWNGKAAAETDVLTLTFRAKQNGKLSEVLTIGSNLTYAEGYDAAGDSYSVNLSFNNGKVSGKEFALYQNEPNPSNSSTKIGFNLPEAAKATLSIYDVTGKLLRTVEGNYTAGYNALTIEKSDLNANGVMYYRLDSGNNTATKKMIIIE